MIWMANQSGSTPLHHAAQRGDIDVVNVLLNYGANPSIKNDLGKSPLDYCDAFPQLRGALGTCFSFRFVIICSLTHSLTQGE